MDEQRPTLAVTFQTLGGNPETLTDPTEIIERILNKALRNPGLVQALMKDLSHQIRESAEDGASYRELADAVTDSIIGDPNDWDGDASELELLVRYLKNARDIARHEVAEEMRKKATASNSRTPFRVVPETFWKIEADDLDPYRREAGISPWIRKSDGTVVSWPIVRD